LHVRADAGEVEQLAVVAFAVDESLLDAALLRMDILQ
jgi:hypothetical protein